MRLPGLILGNAGWLIHKQLRLVLTVIRASASAGEVSCAVYSQHRSRAAIIILDPDDVVLAQIAAGLHLDQFKRNLPGVFHTVGCTDWDVYRFVLVNGLDEVVYGYARSASHHDPVLGSMVVLL